MNNELVIEMKFKAEMKHSVRYESIERDAAVTSVYLMKSHLPETSYPGKITIKVEIE
jgi:hypothetical protein